MKDLIKKLLTQTVRDLCVSNGLRDYLGIVSDMAFLLGVGPRGWPRGLTSTLKADFKKQVIDLTVLEYNSDQYPSEW